MRAGPMRHRVLLQSYTEVQDETGSPVETWADVATVWADVRFRSGLEAVKSDAPVNVTSASIRIHYREGVVPTMRAIHDGRTYDIVSVLADPTGRKYLDLVAQTGENNG